MSTSMAIQWENGQANELLLSLSNMGCCTCELCFILPSWWALTLKNLPQDKSVIIQSITEVVILGAFLLLRLSHKGVGAQHQISAYTFSYASLIAYKAVPSGAGLKIIHRCNTMSMAWRSEVMHHALVSPAIAVSMNDWTEHHRTVASTIYNVLWQNWY